MKKILVILMALVMVIGLAGCSKSAKISGNYTNGSLSDYSYAGTVMGKNYDTYALNLYDDGSYVMTETVLIDMGGTAAGTTTMTTYGTYKKGTAADGFIDVTINAPTRMLYASYSTLGGFAFDYDTDTDTEFIIPGGDDVKIGKDEFLSQLKYNVAKTVYIVLDSSSAETCQMVFNKE